jgi:hypothetical protein
VRLAANLVRTRDRLLFEDAEPAAEPGASTAWSASGELAISRFETAHRLQGWAHGAPVIETSEPDGGMAFLWNAAVLPWRGDARALLLDWRERRFTAGPGDARNSVATRSALLGVRRTAGAALTGRIELGAGEVRNAGPARATRRGAAGALELGTVAGRGGLVSARAEFQSHFPTLATLEAQQRVAGAWLSARAATTMEVAGSPEADRVLVRRFTLAAADTLGGATLLGLEASDVRSSPQTIERPVSRMRRAALALTRRVQPWLQLTGRCALLREWDDGAASPPATRRVVFDTYLAVLL